MNTAQFRMIGSLLLMLVTIASIVITYQKSRKRPVLGSTKPLTPETLVEPLPLVDPNSPGPLTLEQDMSSRLPDHASELNEIYRGRSLHWLVLFKERKLSSDGQQLWLRFLEENTIINLTCDIDAAQIADEAPWSTNQQVWISGTIESISEGTIRLTDVSFE